MMRSIILGAVVAFLAATATALFEGPSTDKVDGKKWYQKLLLLFTSVNSSGWINSIALGVIVGAVNFFTPKLSVESLFMAPVFLAVMIFYHVYLITWWKIEGSELSEVLTFVIMVVLVFRTTETTAIATTGLWDNPFWTSVVTTVPWILGVATIGYFLFNACRFRVEEVYAPKEDDSEEVVKEKKTLATGFNCLSAIVVVVAIIKIKGDY